METAGVAALPVLHLPEGVQVAVHRVNNTRSIKCNICFMCIHHCKDTKISIKRKQKERFFLLSARNFD